MFQKECITSQFSWSDLGDLNLGRPNLGQNVPVLIYRLLQYTIRDIMIEEIGADKATDIFIKGGKLAGMHFCRNILNVNQPFNKFVSELQRVMKEQAIGILRLEKVDMEKMHFVLTVAEDLDCSGLPFKDDTVCQYDEGFIAGVLEEYTGKPFIAKEIDCWASGDRVCRFDVKPKD